MFITHPDSSINLLLSKSGSILDFGCGDGGYSRHISKFYDSIDLFDYEDIINSIDPDISDISNVNLYSDWEIVKLNNYTDILCGLVFQHMHPLDLDIYLKDLSKMTNNLIVKSRNDFNPYIRKELRFEDDLVLPYIEKYFSVKSMEIERNGQWFVGSFYPRKID